MWPCTRTATGSSTENTAGQCRPHHEDMPPPVSKNQPPRRGSSPGPRAGRGAFRHGYMRTGATSPDGGGVWYTRWYTGWDPPPSPNAPAVKKGGSLPSSSSPLARFGSSRFRTKNPNNDGGTWMGAWYTPLSLCGTLPYFARTIFAALHPAPHPAPQRARNRGTLRSPPRGWSAGRWARWWSGQSPRAPSSWRVRRRGAGSRAGADSA